MMLALVFFLHSVGWGVCSVTSLTKCEPLDIQVTIRFLKIIINRDMAWKFGPKVFFFFLVQFIQLVRITVKKGIVKSVKKSFTFIITEQLSSFLNVHATDANIVKIISFTFWVINLLRATC